MESSTDELGKYSVEKLVEAVKHLQAQRESLNKHIEELNQILEDVRAQRDSALELLAAVPDIQNIRRNA